MKSCIGFVLLLGALASACQTTVTRRTVYRAQPVRKAPPARMFEVRHEGNAHGYVVLFEAESRPEEAVYIVRNKHHQDLGLIDALGRAYRYRPHEDTPKWLGSGSIARGVQRILNTDSTPRIHEIPLPDDPDSLPAKGERVAVTDSQRDD